MASTRSVYLFLSLGESHSSGIYSSKMKDLSYDTDRPIAALATPWGRSAIAVVRTSGEGCLDLLARTFSRPAALSGAKSHSLTYGHMLDASGLPIEQVVLGVFHAPRSYTGEESVEIYTHGSPSGIQRLLSRLYEVGFSEAAPGEFTLRAFLNGKIDLTEAEAVAEIIDAKSSAAHAMAMDRLSGSLFRSIDALKKRIVEVLASVEVLLDYPEEELLDAPEPDFAPLSEVLHSVEALSATFQEGRLYREGAKVAIAGRTNAGKSSLFNLFLKEDRSIVSDIHGTTRDYIEAWTTIAGIPVCLYDTAGLRDAGHPVEVEGIRRSGKVVDAADLVLYLIDGTTGPSPDEFSLLADQTSAEGQGRYIFVMTRSDLGCQVWDDGVVAVSAVTGQGLDRLQKKMAKCLSAKAPLTSGEPVVDSLRQKRLLDRCSSALQAVLEGVGSRSWDELAMDLKDAVDALGEITGEVTSADILESIFSDFCLGK
jgi:tRNA modification GTPase